MATIADRDEERAVSIGRIMGRAFGVMGDNPVATFGIALLFGALPQQIFSYYFRLAMLNSAPGNALALSALSIGSVVIYLMLGMLVQAALVRATTAYADGERASFGESVATGLSMALPLIGLTLLLTLGLFAGAILLLVPAFILYVMWSVAAPVLVAERSGVIAAFGRSRYLTKGARWKIFGLFAIVMVLFWLLSGVLGVIIVAGGGAASLAGGPAGLSAPLLILSIVIGTVGTALIGTVQTSLYVTLRNWKEGPQAQALADVFA